MSEKTPHRRPATFKLDDPGVIVMDPDDASRPARGTVHVTPEADPAQLPVPIDMPLLPVRRSFRWGTLFWAAVGGLVLLGLGLGIVNLIEDLFARSESLGFLGLAFAFAAALALMVVIAREAFGLARLGDHRKAASARRRSAAQRRPRGEPGHRRRSAQARAPEPAAGARPRRTAGSCRRHHRRRRHDQARRARIDDAARSGSAAAGLVRRATRLDRHCREPPRADRRAVRVRRLACV